MTSRVSLVSRGIQVSMDPLDLSNRVTLYSLMNQLVWRSLLPLLISVKDSLLTERIENFIRGWGSLGVLTPQDPSGGDSNGVFWSTGSLDPKDETRSYARSAHYDRIIDSRPNYHVLANSAVIKINFEGNTAVGVDYIDREANEVQFVGAAREVVLAAGTVHSPQVLQLSGIGEKEHLHGLGIETVVDLPGVGQNFQDHPSLYVNYKCLFPLSAVPSRHGPNMR